MPGKKVQCSYCSKVMRSDNLKNHIKIHENDRCKITYQSKVEPHAIPDTSIQTCSPFPDITKPASNPKLSAIIDAIVNNGEPSTPVSSPEPFTIPPAPKKIKTLSLGSGISTEEKDQEDEKDMEVDNTSIKEEDSLKKKIADTVDYLITHDKNELTEILEEWEKEELFIDDVLALKKLVEVFVRDEFLENRPVMKDIQNILTKLSSSQTISKSKLVRADMLLNEINQNRARIEEIVKRMATVLDDAVEEDVLRALKELTREGLLSETQYFKISGMMKELDINKLIPVIKEIKIGRGLDYLPRKTSDLLEQLKSWISEFTEVGTSKIRDNVLAALDELLQRKAISKTEYNSMKSDNNIE